MSTALTKRRIAQLPKVDLHCHLDGSVPLAAFRQWAGRRPGIIPQSEEALRRMAQAPAKCSSLAQYLACFGPVLALLRNMGFLRAATLQLLRELADENVIYAELRFAPASLAGKSDAELPVQTVAEALAEGEELYGVQAQAILCLMRGAPEEENRQVIELARRWHGRGVAGVDLAGDEAAWPPEAFGSLFRLAAEAGVPYTLHAGECGSAANVAAAADMGARRIGHGIAAVHSPALMRRLARQNILLEMCPVSNLQTGAVSAWENYPLPQFVEAGVPVCVNTDNRTVSATSLTREIWELARRHHFVNEDFVRTLTRNALQGAFLNETQRGRLLRRLDEE